MYDNLMFVSCVFKMSECLYKISLGFLKNIVFIEKGFLQILLQSFTKIILVYCVLNVLFNNNLAFLLKNSFLEYYSQHLTMPYFSQFYLTAIHLKHPTSV